MKSTAIAIVATSLLFLASCDDKQPQQATTQGEDTANVVENNTNAEESDLNIATNNHNIAPGNIAVAESDIDIDEIITLTSRQINREKYLLAAETITQVSPELFIYYSNNNSNIAADITVLIATIEKSDNKDAIALLSQWGEQVNMLITGHTPIATQQLPDTIQQ